MWNTIDEEIEHRGRIHQHRRLKRRQQQRLIGEDPGSHQADGANVRERI